MTRGAVHVLVIDTEVTAPADGLNTLVYITQHVVNIKIIHL